MHYTQIASYDNYFLANMTLGYLQENGLDCHLKDEYIVTIDPLLNPAVGGIKLMVAEADYAKGLLLLKESETKYLSEIPCPKCHNLTLEVEEKTDAPTDFWRKLKNRILYGQTNIFSKKYRCKNCKSLFQDLPASF